MKINEFDYNFKPRCKDDLILNLEVIYKNLGYSKIDKNNISKIFNLDEINLNSEDYISNLRLKVDECVDANYEDMLDKCEQLKDRWEQYKLEYFSILNKVFDIEIDREIKTYTYCYLHQLPFNEISLKDNIIYLDCNETVDELFKIFIIMLTKLILLNRWNDVNCWDFNIEFDIKNKIWMFAEIAIDAIFVNSELKSICTEPTYKFFYSLQEDGCNVMESFREKYKTLPLDEFFTEVYMFVYNRYNKLLQFKNYLYNRKS